ncbi:UHRF1-binding protein 1-like isoform X3 [Hippocampus zosterae]|uniref:UHRF1-binding protein 1-like isoform X3 n=1 Tax=Hippocampus zosterae TaxID=109293 RepID=UPI00223D11B0|nr:UHRF1-binding protein 1-like isoform X3 [Hippocampus zosterae]
MIAGGGLPERTRVDVQLFFAFVDGLRFCFFFFFFFLTGAAAAYQRASRVFRVAFGTSHVGLLEPECVTTARPAPVTADAARRHPGAHLRGASPRTRPVFGATTWTRRSTFVVLCFVYKHDHLTPRTPSPPPARKNEAGTRCKNEDDHILSRLCGVHAESGSHLTNQPPGGKSPRLRGAMAGLIKKQILKHLSRFAKNLSPDKINLSTLKGEGQLTNLELDEEVLQSLLDLPTWLAINRVGCNKAAIRIPWTKLKTHPISLTLDKVEMEMSTCDEPRSPNGPSPIATASGQSEYGFAEKVVEGMSLSINSIVIRISAKAFNASFELSQLQVYSVNNNWSVSDLRFTRIPDPQRGELLTFKEISWQMIRIEADAIQGAEHDMLSAPIRLITNQSKIRVTLKRRMKDCNVVASKLVLILDDLLWVLTDSQLKAMVQYAKSLSEAMEKSAQQRKSLATEGQASSGPPSAQQAHAQTTTTTAAAAADQSATMAKLFSDYDVCETSHHLQITHLDLHICDDIHAADKAIDKRITGGAMQLSFSSVTLDYYPFHRAGDSCAHWMHYSEATKSRDSWARSLLDEFKSNVEMLKSAVRGQQGAPAHSSPVSIRDDVYWPIGLSEADGTSIERSPRAQPPARCCWCLESGKINTSSTSCFSPLEQSPKTQLMSSSVVLRMADFSIYQVSTADQRRSSPKTMISCNKKSLYLPPEMPAVHVEFTEYYFPDGKDYPIPCPNLYAQLNALQLVLDHRSLVWLNLFALDLRQSLEQFMEIYKLNDSQKPDEHVDVKVDGLMLKVVIPADRDPSCPPDLPRSVSVQTSEMVATNTRHPANCTRAHLEALLQAFQGEPFFSSSFASFPRHSSSAPLLHPVFRYHAHEQDTRLHDIYRGLVTPTMGADALKTPAAADFWALHFAQFWVDYEGKGRPQPFVDSFPLSVWACQPAKLLAHQEKLRGLERSPSADSAGRMQRKRLLKEFYSADGAPAPCHGPSNGLRKPQSLDSLPSSPLTSSGKDADVQVLVQVHKPLSAQVSHSQYVFLMRLQRSIKALQQTLQQDLDDMGGLRKAAAQRPADQRPFTACLGLLLKSAEVSLLLKPVAQTEGSGSPLGSELSPSESRGTLEPGGEGAGKGSSTVDQMLCGDAKTPRGGPDPLVPTAAATSNHQSSHEERTSSSAKNAERWNCGEGGGEMVAKEDETKFQAGEPLCEDKAAANKMPQSTSSSSSTSRSTSLYSMSNIGRLMRDRSQSSFSVTYKNMKESPSLQSLDNISIDSYLLEDGDAFSLMERDDMSISGFKATTDSSAEVTAPAPLPEQEGGLSPDTVSAASQSIDEPSKDIVSVLVLKVHSVCVGMESVGESTDVALEVDKVTPVQLGNVSLRQYLSSRSLGVASSVAAQSGQGPAEVHSPSTGLPRRPEVRARLESGPCAAAHSPLAERNGFLQLRLHGYRAGLLMSTLRNLAHFLEDDTAPQVLPMKISVRDMHVHLKDDGQRDTPSEAEPIALHVDSLLIHRRDDGAFYVGVDAEAKRSVTADGSLSPVAEATQTRAVSASPTKHEQMLTDENECLKVELSRAKMALAEVQMERDSLLHQINSLKVNTS